jgi:hypothetical protein
LGKLQVVEMPNVGKCDGRKVVDQNAFVGNCDNKILWSLGIICKLCEIFGKSLGILWCFEILWGLCGFWGTIMTKHNEMTNLFC